MRAECPSFAFGTDGARRPNVLASPLTPMAHAFTCLLALTNKDSSNIYQRKGKNLNYKFHIYYLIIIFVMTFCILIAIAHALTFLLALTKKNT